MGGIVSQRREVAKITRAKYVILEGVLPTGEERPKDLDLYLASEILRFTQNDTAGSDGRTLYKKFQGLL